MGVCVGCVAVAYAPILPTHDSARDGILSALSRAAAAIVHQKSGPETFVSGSQSTASCASSGLESGSGSASEWYTAGFAREVISVPANVRLGGYGLFPFSMLWEREAFTMQSSSHIPVETLVISQGQNSWVFISVPVVGLTFSTVQQIEGAVRGLTRREEHTGKELADDSPCTLVTVSATHTHSAPDSIGLWGGASPRLLWWKVQKDHREVFLEPLVRAAGSGARRAVENLLPVQVDLRQGTLSTTALKRRQGEAAVVGHAERIGGTSKQGGPSGFGQVGTHHSEMVNSHILRLGDVASIWIADAHAATNLGRGANGKAGLLGDFPQHISEELKKSSAQGTPLIYAPGLIGRSYPDEEDHWPESWVQSLKQAVDLGGTAFPLALGEEVDSTQFQSIPSDGSLRFNQIDLCARPTSHLFPLFEFWSQLWSGEDGRDPCDSLKPGWRTVRLQSVHIAGVHFVFTPFELFPHAAASLARVLKAFDSHLTGDVQHVLTETDGANVSAPVVFVSLANGFLGYAADPRSDDVEPYHRLLSIFDPLPEKP